MRIAKLSWMNKAFAVIITAVMLLSACGRETADAPVEKNESMAETLADDSKASCKYFSACLKDFSLPSDDEGMVVAVFEFTNITDKTYYKNGEDEIVPGGTWEKNISYSKEKWTKLVGVESWIHYKLYEAPEDQEPIFEGGLSFKVSEDLSVTGLYTFEE